MFDVKLEYGELQSRLQDVLGLECLSGEELASALVDYGYINAILEFDVTPSMSTYDVLLDAIITYEEASQC